MTIVPWTAKVLVCICPPNDVNVPQDLDHCYIPTAKTASERAAEELVPNSPPSRSGRPLVARLILSNRMFGITDISSS